MFVKEIPYAIYSLKVSHFLCWIEALDSFQGISLTGLFKLKMLGVVSHMSCMFL